MTDQEKTHNKSLSEGQILHKQQVWNDLIRLIYATENIKKEYYDKIHRDRALTCNLYDWTDDLKDEEVRMFYKRKRDERYAAVDALFSLFSDVPDKQQAWSDLHRLTNDEDSYVRSKAAESLGSVFSDVPDKQQAWNDLIRLINDEDIYVRSKVAEVLGYAYSQVPDKRKVWNCLIELKNDSNVRVKATANYSLGKASIFKASHAESDMDYKRELEAAIYFFEEAAKRPWWSLNKGDNPSEFCLPFYRSYHAILFEQQEAIKEVDRYLAKAKDAAKGSKSKEQLFETVESLSKALKEVQNLENLDLEAKKKELNSYRQYCEHAEKLMRDTEEKAPFATGVLRKGLPILDKNLKELLEEIQNKAKVKCNELKGTPAAEIACTINKEVQKWEISNPEKMAQYIEDLAYLLKNKVVNLPEKEQILGKIDLMVNEKDLTKKFQHLIYIIGLLPGGEQVYINANYVITNPKNSKISFSRGINTSGDTTKPLDFFMISKLILEHPIIATVVGGIIVIIIQKKYFI